MFLQRTRIVLGFAFGSKRLDILIGDSPSFFE